MSLSLEPRVWFGELRDELGRDLLEQTLILNRLAQQTERGQRRLLRLEVVPIPEHVRERNIQRSHARDRRLVQVEAELELDVGEEEAPESNSVGSRVSQKRTP